MLAATRIVPKAVDAFRTGDGIGWHEHDPDLFQGTNDSSGRDTGRTWSSRGSQPWTGPKRNCGPGRRSRTLAAGTARPRSLWPRLIRSRIFGGSITTSRRSGMRERCAAKAGLSDRVTFEVATAKEYPGADYDLVCHFDCLHDMGDPVGAAAHARGIVEGRRALAAGRAVRQRRPGGQSQPDRARLLLRLYSGLHPGVAVSGGRRCAGRPGRRRQARAKSRGRRVRHVPAATETRSISCSKDAPNPPPGNLGLAPQSPPRERRPGRDRGNHHHPPPARHRPPRTPSCLTSPRRDRGSRVVSERLG